MGGIAGIIDLKPDRQLKAMNTCLQEKMDRLKGKLCLKEPHYSFHSKILPFLLVFDFDLVWFSLLFGFSFKFRFVWEERLQGQREEARMTRRL